MIIMFNDITLNSIDLLFEGLNVFFYICFSSF